MLPTFLASAVVLLAACSNGVAAIDTERLTLRNALVALAKGAVTSEALTSAYLAKIACYEDAYNAFTYLNPHALRQARASDAKRAAGGALGALEGVPIVIKESMDHKGWPSTLGWSKTATQTGGVELIAVRHSAVVHRLKKAGAIILGKTNIPAFSDDGTRASSSWAGPTYNAVLRTRAPGASSSGTAAAVSAGFAAWGMAEETGGSIQDPAAAQSLVGVKTTLGLVNTRGVVPLSSLRDVLGPIAKNVRDAAIALDVIARPKYVPPGGFGALLGAVTLAGKRVGLYGTGWKALPKMTAEIRGLYAEAVTELEQLGATTVPDPFAGTGFADLALPGGQYDYRGSETLGLDFTAYLEGLGISSIAAFKAKVGVDPFDPGEPLNFYVANIPELAASLQDLSKPANITAFEALKASYLAIFQQVFEQHNLDALVFPQALTRLPRVGGTVPLQASTVSEINIMGLPGVTVPSVRSGDRIPFGLIFVGPPHSEALLLALAHDYEIKTHHRLHAHLLHSTCV